MSLYIRSYRKQISYGRRCADWRAGVTLWSQLCLISVWALNLSCGARLSSGTETFEAVDESRKSRSAEILPTAPQVDGGTVLSGQSSTLSDEGLFPSNAIVVLLAGLAGDIESEKAYRDQLAGWLQVSLSQVSAKNTFILCDNAEAMDRPIRGEAKAFKADRQSLLALGRTLAGITNPVTVIVWGHGGKQGATPVFHVRGPRLTPQDFGELAAGFRGPVSRWLLMFRGSGAFARQLAGEHRKILSSECETTFASDPVGASLLLKLARSAPDSSFDRLAQNFGRAIGGWYEERHLARTEDPALWVGTEKPRRLLDTDAGGSFPSAEQSAYQLTMAVQKLTTEEPQKATTVSADLSVAWNEIKKVQPEKYPEADAVILKQSFDCTFGSNPALVTEEEQFVQIVTLEGGHFGDFDVSYSPPDEELDFLDCEVLRSDGKMVRLDPDSIKEAAEPSVGDYQIGRRKFFSLPGISPGAVLHVRYRKQWKDFPLPQLWLELPIEREIPAVNSTIRVGVPKEAPFHFSFEGIATPDPVLKQSSYATTLSWCFTSLGPKRQEVLSSPHSGARLLLSTFRDWDSSSQTK